MQDEPAKSVHRMRIYFWLQFYDGIARELCIVCYEKKELLRKYKTSTYNT
jgi:hypothetical protein